MHQALYRKWRPRTFEEMAGQEATRTVLQREVENGRLSHAYLFCGTRGTGKTTAAKILAKAVNCLAPENGNPCNKCEICRGIDEESIMDVQEIDAASNNGVDNIREIREEVLYSPSKAKYRVYIIDEVHMLSQGAFNALLKTLEEPPPHVLFILATTELHKIPATILSRCQSFEFKRISIEDMVKRLSYVAFQEKIGLTDSAAVLIARLADGALRNALSILEQCSAEGENITDRIVFKISGLAGREYLFDISKAIAEQDGAKGIAAVDKACQSSKEPSTICTELLSHFRDILILKTVSSGHNILLSPPSEFENLEKIEKSFTAPRVLQIISVLQGALDGQMKSMDKKLALEVAILTLCSPVLDKSGETILARIENLEKMLKDGERVQILRSTENKPIATLEHVRKKENEDVDMEDLPPWDTENNVKLNMSEPREVLESETESPAKILAPPVRTKVKNPLAFWSDVLSNINPSIGAFLGQITPIFQGEKLVLETQNPFHFKMLSKDSAQKEIENAVFKITKTNYEIIVKNVESGEITKEENPLFNKLADEIDKTFN